MAIQFQETIKSASSSLTHVVLRLISGFFIALTAGLIIQELLKGGVFTFLFSGVVVLGAVYKSLARFSISQILVFDLICVLTALLLRMYILVAPG